MMTIRERLVFLLTPLVVLPLILVTLFSIFLFKSLSPAAPIQLFELLSLAFIVLVSVTTLVSVLGVANYILKPIRLLIQDARHIAQGNLELTPFSSSHFEEIDQLSATIEQMKSDLKRQRVMLQEAAADEAMGKLIAQVAHDMASPLTVITGAAKYFAELPSVDEMAREYAQMLSRASLRLMGIAKDLMDRRRREHSKKLLFLLSKAIDELVQEYETHNECDCVQFEKKYDDFLVLFGDRVQFQRAIGNVVKNGIEAMEKCGTLTIETKRLSESSMLLEISDTGCGMSPEVLEKVLAGGFNHGKADGHGIGMTVVKKVVAEQRGHLTARSQEAVGTTFSMEFPPPDDYQLRHAEQEDGLSLEASSPDLTQKMNKVFKK